MKTKTIIIYPLVLRDLSPNFIRLLRVVQNDSKQSDKFHATEISVFFVRKQLKRGFEAELSRVVSRKNDFNERFATLASNFSPLQDSYPQERIWGQRGHLRALDGKCEFH